MTEQDLVTAYWAEAAEKRMLATGTREQRLEYQSRAFPVEESLSARVDAKDPTLLDDLVQIAEAAPDDAALELFGAGSVWEILYSDYGRGAEIEQAARSSAKFLHALRAGFTSWDGVPPATKQRLKDLFAS